MSRQVNRYLVDDHFDHIDHGLGRPVDPLDDTYRDYFALSKGDDMVEEMTNSPHWRRGLSDGHLIYFHVTTAGRKALRDHLKAIGDRHRLFYISWDGITITEVAETRAKARYAAFLSASDCDPDLTFKQFQAEARVRLSP
ncbi:MAG: hypothetical protein ABGX47_23915 [Martelella sp.]|uniref:hypothetical protein n=1 Tax=Martelella sp. TaxID=1969699 RepID=UPI003242AB8A